MSSKLEPAIWLCVLVTLAYMKGQTDGRTDVHDIMAIKPNFLTSMGYHIFLTMVLCVRAGHRSSAVIHQTMKIFLSHPPSAGQRLRNFQHC